MKKLLFIACFVACTNTLYAMESAFDPELLKGEDTKLISNLGETFTSLAKSPNIPDNLAVIDFEQLYRNNQYKINQKSLSILKANNLIQEDGTIHPAIKEIIKQRATKKQS